MSERPFTTSRISGWFVRRHERPSISMPLSCQSNAWLMTVMQCRPGRVLRIREVVERFPGSENRLTEVRRYLVVSDPFWGFFSYFFVSQLLVLFISTRAACTRTQTVCAAVVSEPISCHDGCVENCFRLRIAIFPLTKSRNHFLRPAASPASLLRTGHAEVSYPWEYTLENTQRRAARAFVVSRYPSFACQSSLSVPVMLALL